MQNELGMQIQEGDVQVAHRVGIKGAYGPCQMVVKCSTRTRAAIFKHTKNLKGKRNSQNKEFFVDPQLPEPMQAERRELTYEISKIKKYNSTTQNKVNYSIQQGKLYINNEVVKKKVIPPKASDIVTLSREEYDRIVVLQMNRSLGIEQQGSKFVAYAKRVNSVNAISDLYKAVKIWHPECDHITMAYLIGPDAGCCDDGEYSAGLKLQKLLEQRKEDNTVVFVAREYGGIQLRPRQFATITDQAREVLVNLS